MILRRFFKTCPGHWTAQASAYNHKRHNCGRLMGIRFLQHPHLRHIQSQMKDPRGLIILGEALGEDPTDPYPMGNEAFISDHLRDVTQAVITDLSKIAVLPDRLEGDTAGLQVAWALISKTLPPRVVHLLRARPVEQPRKCVRISRMHLLTLSDS